MSRSSRSSTRSAPTRGRRRAGINAAVGKEDSVDTHIYDTVKGSDYLGDQDAIEFFCREAGPTVVEMEHFGTIFSRASDGSLARRAFGGAGFPRTIYAADRTGLALLQATLGTPRHGGVHALRGVGPHERSSSATGGSRGSSRSTGSRGDFEEIAAKSVVLATGPFGRTYGRTTNAHSCTGDGVAAAYEVGAYLKDMEFVQFHPTALLESGILITEGARGEGGILKNAAGRAIHEPLRAARARPRLAGRRFPGDRHRGRRRSGLLGAVGRYVHLELMHLGKEKVESRLQEIVRLLAGFSPGSTR